MKIAMDLGHSLYAARLSNTFKISQDEGDAAFRKAVALKVKKLLLSQADDDIQRMVQNCINLHLA